jgi:transcriptional regulator with XRE-family HTH domain
MDIQIAFGRSIRKLREQRRLSQEALGDLVGFNATYVSRIERGVQNVGLKTIQKIAKALKTSPEKLFKGIR